LTDIERQKTIKEAIVAALKTQRQNILNLWDEEDAPEVEKAIQEVENTQKWRWRGEDEGLQELKEEAENAENITFEPEGDIGEQLVAFVDYDFNNEKILTVWFEA